MNRSTLHFVDKQSMTAEQPIQRGHRKVAEMLMIYSIELAVLNEIEQVGRLDNENSVIVQEKPSAFDKPVEIRHMGEDVIGGKNVRPFPPREVDAPTRKERVERVDPRFGAAEGPLAGSIPRTGMPRNKVSQQVAIVRSGFDDKLSGPDRASQ